MSSLPTLALAGLTVLAMLASVAPAAASPAVDEYGANLPTAGGHRSQGSTVPQSHPEQLPPSVAQKLESSSNGKKLGAVATASELGAPSTAGKAAGNPPADSSDSGFLSGAGGTLGDPLVLVLIAALALSGIAAWRLRRGSPS